MAVAPCVDMLYILMEWQRQSVSCMAAGLKQELLVLTCTTVRPNLLISVKRCIQLDEAVHSDNWMWSIMTSKECMLAKNLVLWHYNFARVKQLQSGQVRDCGWNFAVTGWKPHWHEYHEIRFYSETFNSFPFDVYLSKWWRCDASDFSIS